MKCRLTREQKVFIEKNFNCNHHQSLIEEHVVFNALEKEGIEPPVTSADITSYISYRNYSWRTVFSRIWGGVMIKHNLSKYQVAFIEKNFDYGVYQTTITTGVIFNALSDAGLSPPVKHDEVNDYVYYRRNSLRGKLRGLKLYIRRTIARAIRQRKIDTQKAIRWHDETIGEMPWRVKSTQRKILAVLRRELNMSGHQWTPSGSTVWGRAILEDEAKMTMLLRKSIPGG